MRCQRICDFISFYVIFISSFLSSILCFDLKGSEFSYAKFPKWKPCQNGSFSLEFKTKSSDGLILYMDDGGRSDYIELKLIQSLLHLKFNFGGGDPMRLTVGHILSDDNWHKVTVSQGGHNMTLTVDDESERRIYHRNDIDFGNYETNTHVFIGGIGIEYLDRTNELTMPHLFFEKRFNGSIRNVLYSNCGGPFVRPEMLEYQGIQAGNNDCLNRNPCRNGGICLTGDNGLSCDCSSTKFGGRYCEIDKVPPEVTLFGSQYFTYDLTSKGNGIDSSNDELNMYFRTTQPSGLLFFTGQGNSDYMNVALKNGGIIVTVNLGSGGYQGEIRPDRLSFDDNQWHHLRVTRETREVHVTVDGIHRDQGTTAGQYTRLGSNLLYAGGSPNTDALPGSRVNSNFKGCLKEVTYRAGSLFLDLINLAVSASDFITVVGNVAFNQCQDMIESKPITFQTPESFIVLPSWDVGIRGGSISFTFQTNEPNGVIMYNSGMQNSDFFAFELLDGYLNFIIDLGSGSQKVKVFPKRVNDEKPHTVLLEHGTEKKGRVYLDGQPKPYVVPGDSSHLDLDGVLYVGGIKDYKNVYSLPKELWAGMLKYGFVGCLLDLAVNGNKVDVLTVARKQMRSGIKDNCQVTEPQCMTSLCKHRGVCNEGWNRFVCDCRMTEYVGTICQTPAATLSFDGAQYVRIVLPEDSHTEAEDIALRFKTKRPSGLLLVTSSDRVKDSVILYLESGVLKFEINIASVKKVLTVGRTRLNDDRWHSVLVQRRGEHIELTLDHENPVADLLTGRYVPVLQVQYIVLGSVGPMPFDDMPKDTRALQFQDMTLGQMVRDDNMLRRHTGFIGDMQQFIFNNNHFFEMAKSQDIQNIEVTAQFTDTPVLQNPVTFKSQESYVLLPKLNAYLQFSIYFKFKTTESAGLILYNGGEGYDFIALELQSGYLHYVYNTGDGARRIVVSCLNPLNDNKWHDVSLIRTTVERQMISVDDNPATIEEMGDSIKFNLQGQLYVGGVKKTMYNSLPKQISSRHGFQGCMASVYFNGQRPNLASESEAREYAVVEGCSGPSNACYTDSCFNGGRCVQQWNSYLCDCDMTSYTGSMCKDESIAYTFGPGPGLITYSHAKDKYPDTKEDQVAFGFTSTQRNGILLRAESISSEDFIQIELSDGKIYVEYNMGTTVLPVGLLYHEVSDGKYHVVRFTRRGANATVQVDNSKPAEKYPSDQEWKVFNSQARIYVGGKINKSGNIEKAFNGTIAGLVFNSIPILRLASKRNSQISMKGNVHVSIPQKKSGGSVVRNIQSTMGVRTEMNEENNGSIADSNTVTQVFVEGFQDKVLLHRFKKSSDSSINSIKKSKRKKRTNTWRGNSASPRRDVDELVSQETEWQTSEPGSGDGGNHSDDEDDDDVVNQLFSGVGSAGGNLPDYDDGEANIVNILSQSIDTVNPEWRETLKNTYSNPNTYQEKKDSIHHHLGDDSIIKNSNVRWNLMKPPDSDTFPKDRGKSHILLSSDQINQKLSHENRTIVHFLRENDKTSSTTSATTLSDVYNRASTEFATELSVGNKRASTKATTALTDGYNRTSTESATELSGGGNRARVKFATEISDVEKASTKSSKEPNSEDFVHTTPRQGTTEDIISPSFEGSGCQSDDEDEDCTSSGQEEEIFYADSTTPSTPRPSVTPSTKKSPNPCENADCTDLTKIQSEIGPATGDASGEYEKSEPSETTNKEYMRPSNNGNGNKPNIGLIVGIIAGVLVALVILGFALYKFSSRDEGTYKVDETQNFACLDSKKQQGNGTLLNSNGSTVKNGKKKDVKEWYV